MNRSKLDQAEALFEKAMEKVKEDMKLQSTEVLQKTLESFEENPVFQNMDQLQKHFWKEMLLSEIQKREEHSTNKHIH